MNRHLPHLAIIIAALLWSLDAFLRQSLYTLSPLLIITLEHGIGSLLFTPILVSNWKKLKTLKQTVWISLLWISILGGICGTYFYTKALSYVGYIDLSVVVLLQKFQPLFAVSLAAIVLKEKLSKRYLVLALCAMIGGYLVTFGSNPISIGDNNTLIAALFSLLAAFCWGSSTVLGKQALIYLSFSLVTAMRLIITTIVGSFIIIYSGWSVIYSNITYEQWKALLLIVISTGTVALFIYYYGLKKLPASHTTLFELFWPLSAVMIDWVIIGNPLSTPQLSGAVILLASMTILTQERFNERS
jgi:drug/metabolite transporter (DMT)-like permease